MAGQIRAPGCHEKIHSRRVAWCGWAGLAGAGPAPPAKRSGARYFHGPGADLPFRGFIFTLALIPRGAPDAGTAAWAGRRRCRWRVAVGAWLAEGRGTGRPGLASRRGRERRWPGRDRVGFRRAVDVA